MGSVRSKTLYNEQGLLTLSFNYDGTIVYTGSFYDGSNHSAQIGKLVVLASDSTVGLGTTGGFPLGKLIKVEPNACTVEVAGTVQVPYISANANPPLVGRGITTDGAGNALTPAGGVRLATERGIVLSVDAVNQLCYVLFGGGGN